MKTPTDRRRKPTTRAVGLARILTEQADGLFLTTCSCGWEKIHQRRKVSEDSAESHVNRKHEGRALWL